MNGKEMRNIVKNELEYIPKDEPVQKLLRFTYNMIRQNHLSQAIEIPKEKTLLACFETIRKVHPDFKAKYDPTFFRLDLKN